MKMKNKSHQELTKLVVTNDPSEFNTTIRLDLIKYSIEPDETNKQRIMENILNALTIPIEWLVNHTIRAKDLAIRCIWSAYEAKQNEDPNWVRYLGWALHYIADWSTPHHSPISRSNPVPAITGLGTLIGALLGGLAKSGEGLEEVLKGAAKGALIGGGISGVASIVGLAIEHNAFEIECDNRWDVNSNLTIQRFNKLKNNFIPSKEIGIAFESFEGLMEDLRYECNNLRSDWISVSSDGEYSDYLGNIALVMNFACQMVMR